MFFIILILCAVYLANFSLHLAANHAAVAMYRRARAENDIRSATTATNAPRLIVLLPAHNEADLVPATLAHFADVAGRFRKVTIAVITSPSEGQAAVAGVRTADAARSWLLDNPVHADKVLHLSDNDANSSKSSKLNHAVAVVAREMAGAHEDEIYLAVFDFDSRPEPDVFAEFFRRTASSDPASIYQQVPFPIGDGIDGFLTASIARTYSISHVERCLFLETYYYNRFDTLPSVLRSFRGCMGAGLFIRYRTIHAVGGFPKQSDDIYLGYILDLLGEKRQALLAPNYVQPNPDLWATTNQLGRIFRGVYIRPWAFRHGAENVGANIGRAMNWWRYFLTLSLDASISIRCVLHLSIVLLAVLDPSNPWALSAALLTTVLQHLLFHRLVTNAREISALRKARAEIRLPMLEWLIGPYSYAILRALGHLRFFQAILLGMRGTPSADESTRRFS